MEAPLPPPSRRAKRPRTTSHERRHVPPFRRGGITRRGRRRPHHLLRPCSNQAPNWGAKCARTAAALSSSEDQQYSGSLPPSSCAHIQIVPSRGCDDHHSLFSSSCAQIQVVSSRGCDDAPRKKHMLRPCSSIQPPPNYYWRAKRARTKNNNWRDWSNLDDGPAGLIAERVLVYDVADYLRFRAVCRPWRQCCADPRAHGDLDRRFHPRRWVLLREPLAAAPNRRRFLNSSTGEFIQQDLPELLDYELLAPTPEGLLVLLCRHNHDDVCLLNPLTRHLTKLPPLTTLLPREHHYNLFPRFKINYFIALGSGIADDDSTVVLCFSSLRMFGIAKPGDDRWMLLNYRNGGMQGAPLLFAGRLYHVKPDAVMVLQLGTTNQPQPRLEVAAKLKMHVSPMEHSMHLVDNCGELLLVHHQVVTSTSRNKSGYRYGIYRVDLDAGRVSPVKSLGGGAAGRAMFLSTYCSLVVSPGVFPFGSISADTIYLSFDFHERTMLKVGAYHLADRRIERPCSSLVTQPHTLVDYLTLSSTVKEKFIPFP